MSDTPMYMARLRSYAERLERIAREGRAHSVDWLERAIAAAKQEELGDESAGEPEPEDPRTPRQDNRGLDI